jgi:hypothetical protein
MQQHLFSHFYLRGFHLKMLQLLQTGF